MNILEIGDQFTIRGRDGRDYTCAVTGTPDPHLLTVFVDIDGELCPPTKKS